VQEALARAGLALSSSNVTIQRGGRQTLQVTMTKAGKATTLISRQGSGFYGPGTAAEIVESIRKAL